MGTPVSAAAPTMRHHSNDIYMTSQLIAAHSSATD